MTASKEEGISQFKQRVRGVYKPNGIFANILQPSIENESVFDSVVVYQIQGSKFEQILDPSQIGIFDASKSYFIIFS